MTDVRVYITHEEFRRLFKWVEITPGKHVLRRQEEFDEWLNEELPGDDRVHLDVRKEQDGDEPDPTWEMVVRKVAVLNPKYRTGLAPLPERRVRHLVFQNNSDAVHFKLRWLSGE